MSLHQLHQGILRHLISKKFDGMVERKDYKSLGCILVRKKYALLSLLQVLPEDYCKEDPCNFPWGEELARS